MTLLIKDHKTWSMIPKTRSVMGGNEGGNCGISEFFSLVLEPVAREQDNNMEIIATNGLLADIADLNDELDEERRNVPTPEEEMYTLQEESSSNRGAMPNQEGDHDVAEQSVDGEVPDHHQDDHTARGEKTGHYSGSHCSTQQDIRQFLKHGRKGEPSFVSNPNKEVKDEPLDKMRIIRNKMIDARRAADKEEARKSMAKQPPMREWEGEVVVHAREVDNAKVQDQSEVVVVGADVEALYPNLVDIEIANITYDTIMKSKINFRNINYRKALLYLAINMNKTDQRTSSLWRVLPGRTSRGGQV